MNNYASVSAVRRAIPFRTVTVQAQDWLSNLCGATFEWTSGGSKRCS